MAALDSDSALRRRLSRYASPDVLVIDEVGATSRTRTATPISCGWRGVLPRTPELVVTILGTWRAGAVYQPLFTAFGPKAIEHRLRMSGAKLVVTDAGNRPKLDDIGDAPAAAVVTRPDGNETVRTGDFAFHAGQRPISNR